ncbi:hypothetical protein IDJ75_00360 [Mucilaginibacter rigui]|uniref:Uncharacterized protein n=1 Tax=Mucilaginibacter rigui TaxID=534635 RepID=A0ABR7WZE4_9SPHI|nr:hypothetical protein [Mucilaginibacter rigui]MBD1383713.1 hypothetical protein [Mucilaginibacter rigui]
MKIIKALLLLTIVFSVSSCIKEDNNPTRIYAITANVDGSATSFNTNVTSTTGTTSGSVLTTIKGNAADGSTLSITIKGDLVEGKTYSAATVGATQTPIISYVLGSDTYLNNNTGANLVSVTITEATDTLVEGTFKGDLATVATGDATVKNKAITNGIFTAKVVK